MLDLSVMDRSMSGNQYATRTDLYDERRTVYSGIGAFATNFIPSGTRLFCEEALFLLPNEADQVELYKIVKALPEKQQDAFWGLAASPIPKGETSHIESIRKSYQEGTSDDFNKFVHDHEQAWSRYETNRFTINIPGTPKMLGVFPMSARLNHSCAPNVFHRFNPLIKRLTVHALRDIHRDEELFTSYIDISRPTVARRQLLKNWGFSCQCTFCNAGDDSADLRRKTLEKLLTKIHRWEKEQETSGIVNRRDDEKSLKTIQHGIWIMEEEAMQESDTAGLLYSLAAKHAINLDMWPEAVAWAEQAVSVERKCLGEDSREYQVACELEQKARSYAI